uniref:T-box domain-containing protein n=1 Tax=Caenorhabditis tropicalis TaxID=1561998 RepID=A0A1I7TES3_9PELO
MRSKYAVLFEIIPSDKYRYKFTNGGWKVMGKADIEPLRFPILHSDGVQTGEFWMSKDVVFKKLKLTNTTFSEPNHIFLSSMHKYHPRVHIIQYDRFDNPIHSTLRSFVFKYTDFIAVTAYQNEMITQKKIDCNPFAKGFRNKKEEGGRSHKRIFRSEEEDEEPAAKKQKTENESENRKLNPEQIMELMKQYQWVIQSSFGIVPIVEPLKKSPIKKKCGFGVMDLLADVR